MQLACLPVVMGMTGSPSCCAKLCQPGLSTALDCTACRLCQRKVMRQSAILGMQTGSGRKVMGSLALACSGTRAVWGHRASLQSPHCHHTAWVPPPGTRCTRSALPPLLRILVLKAMMIFTGESAVDMCDSLCTLAQHWVQWENVCLEPLHSLAYGVASTSTL